MSEQKVQDFYRKKNIFITGGTGFVGICLVEKLLRTIPDIDSIYLLIRPKRGKEIKERLAELKDVSVFDHLKQTSSPEQFDNLFGKLHAIGGDVSQRGLAMSADDRALLCREVHVVFHCAASLDFQEPLRPTVNINLLGTRQVAELCGEMENLACLVHVSSAYVNSFLVHAEEKIYPLMEDPEKVIKLVAELDDEELLAATPELLGQHPNTYTFTKHMAEHEVQRFEDKYPCAIVRPSMICGSWQEPMCGWTISKNGPQGFIMGALSGVVRRLPLSTSNICDYIPVDIVINTLLVAACYVGTTKSKTVEVYQATSSVRKPFRWNLVEDKINGYLHRYPSNSAVWYPYLKLLPSYTWFKISALFVHMLPALILDGLLSFTGGKTKLCKLHRNINNSLELLHKFIFAQWTFPADRTEDLHKWLSLEEQKSFGVSLQLMDWRNYFINICLGARLYLCKESEASLPAAKNKNVLLYLMHVLLQGALYFFFWWLTTLFFGTSTVQTIISILLIYFIFSLI